MTVVESPTPNTGINGLERSPAIERERLLKKSVAQNTKYGTTSKAAAKSGSDDEDEEKAKTANVLLIAFITMIVIGTGNRIFMKLQTIPMYNYPFFLNMLTTFIYIPGCLLYIIPMITFGTSITPEQRAIPRYKFAVMGFLDAIAGIMGTFAVNYISNASMIVLLQQAAIPISMVISKCFLGARYSAYQYTGATVVIAGIIVTLIPTFFGGGAQAVPGAAAADVQIFWSFMQVLSCIPMCLSSVYKEKALGEVDIDVFYLNGWVAWYQFLASILFAVPSAYAMGLPVTELPANTIDGLMCYLGYNSVTPNMAEGFSSGGHVDHCEMAPFYVNAYLFFNIIYNVVLIVILKHGSASVLWLSSTIMVPIGNVAFSLHFIPGHQDLHASDMLGLYVILFGLLLYRFSGPLVAWVLRKRLGKSALEMEDLAGRHVKLVERGVTRSHVKYIGLNQAEYLEPVIETRVWSAQRMRLSRSPAQLRGSFLLRLGIPPSPNIRLAGEGRSPQTKSLNHAAGNAANVNRLLSPYGGARVGGSPGGYISRSAHGHGHTRTKSGGHPLRSEVTHAHAAEPAEDRL